jgi:hypothetical protein
VTDNVIPMPDQFDPAGFKAFCAANDIECTLATDAFGRTDFHLDRANVEKIWALKLLADEYTARGGK